MATINRLEANACSELIPMLPVPSGHHKAELAASRSTSSIVFIRQHLLGHWRGSPQPSLDGSSQHRPGTCLNKSSPGFEPVLGFLQELSKELPICNLNKTARQ